MLNDSFCLAGWRMVVEDSCLISDLKVESTACGLEISNF